MPGKAGSRIIASTLPKPVGPSRQALDRAHLMIRAPAGAIRFWAKGLERLYGYTTAEALGGNSHRLLRTEFPCPLSDIESELRETGEWQGELAQRRRDGERVVVASHWVSWRDRSRRRLVTEFSNEIGEDARAYLASIVECSDDAIIGKTPDGMITSWNKAAERMFGYAADEVRGQPISLLYPPERLAEGHEILARVRQGERVDHFESVRRRKDGSDILVSLTISPIRDRAGRIIGVSKIARDITEQAAARERLKLLETEVAHASRLSTMGHMAAAITHELNQPLTAVSSYLSGLARLLSESSPGVRDGLGKAREQTTRAGEIVRRLRNLALKGESSREIADINDIVEQTLALALVDAKVRGMSTRVSLANGLPPVLVDKVQIGQVVLNIVRNALEAMEGSPERTLTIATACCADGVTVSIADTGPGLAPEIAARLFQPFISTKEKGMGLGLAICHDIIDSHDGRLSAAPNQPRGTVFLIRLPGVDEPSE